MGFVKKKKMEFHDSLREICVIDFETTGLKAGADRVIEVGVCVLEDGSITEKFQTLMNPGMDIPPEITTITGITTPMVKDAPTPEQTMPELRRFIKNRPIMAHNASFDKRFLDAEMDLVGRKVDNQTMCTLLLARRLVTDSLNHKLPTLASHYGIKATDAHRALADVIVTGQLWLKLYNLIREISKIDQPDMKVIDKLCKTPKARVMTMLEALGEKYNN